MFGSCNSDVKCINNVKKEVQSIFNNKKVGPLFPSTYVYVNIVLIIKFSPIFYQAWYRFNLWI